MSISTNWTCDRCGARVELPGHTAETPANWIRVANAVIPSASGSWRDARDWHTRVACSPACAEALAHELVSAAFAAGDVCSLDLLGRHQQPEPERSW